MRRLRIIDGSLNQNGGVMTVSPEDKQHAHALEGQAPGVARIKVAFATQDLKRVDAHFGWAKNIAIYEISPEASRLVEAVQFDGDLLEDGNEDKLAPKLEAIKECAMLYVAAIGGTGAARVVAKNIHPVKVTRLEEIADILIKLQDVLKGTPPPWLRKAIHKGQERTVVFDDEV
jgi:nitrogen fixation protein NifX